MKRLVTQFDDTRTRATVATPTCCCCCCCCVASIVTSTAVTVLNAHQLAGQTDMPRAQRWAYRIWALVALPLAVLVGTGVALLFEVVDRPDAYWAGLFGFMAAWAALLRLLYRRLGLTRSGRVVAITVIFGTALFLVELFVVVTAVVLENEDTLAYFLFALGVPAGLVPLLRRWMKGHMRRRMQS